MCPPARIRRKFLVSEENKHAYRITRKAALMWLGLIFFVMGWMFVLGILVGRGTAPIPLKAHKLENELTALKAAIEQKEQAQLQKQATDGEAPRSELGFYEALKEPLPKTRERKVAPAAVVVKPAPEPPKAKPAASEAPQAQVAAPKAVTPPAAAPSPPKAAAAAKPAAPQPNAPAAPEAPPATDRYTVQVASFKEIESADEMVNRLRAKGFPAYHVHMDVPGKGAWFRVRVGAFADRSVAEHTLKGLKNQKFGGMVVSTP